MHLVRVNIRQDKFPRLSCYPFNLPIFLETRTIGPFAPVTFFIGENGTGKSTLLKAITMRCGINIWQGDRRIRFARNPYEEKLYRAIEVQWAAAPVPGAFFDSQLFRNFAQIVDEWAANDPGVLNYYGGKSLLQQSHGQSLMAYFQSRFQIEGLYLLDEPETALSPNSQLTLLRLLRDMSRAGHAQFVIATHSPILLACPGACIFSFDAVPICSMAYEDTDYYRIYKRFMQNPGGFLSESSL
jgi:predicted ATPase